MYRIYDCLANQHDIVLVIIALLIGLAGIHTAFNMYARACIGRLRQKIAWLFLTGVVTGGASGRRISLRCCLMTRLYLSAMNRS